MIRESSAKLLASIARVQRFQKTNSGNPSEFRAALLELRRELVDYQKEIKGILMIRNTLSSKSSDELISVLSNASDVCDNIVFLTEMNPNSDPGALAARLNDEGGLSNVETLLKAYFPR